MFEDIENYVYRIGRIGRSGKIGVVIIFINKFCDEFVLLDLKYLLLEVKQKLFLVFVVLQVENEGYFDFGEERGCVYCGGFGYRIIECLKLEVM